MLSISDCCRWFRFGIFLPAVAITRRGRGVIEPAHEWTGRPGSLSCGKLGLEGALLSLFLDQDFTLSATPLFHLLLALCTFIKSRLWQRWCLNCWASDGLLHPDHRFLGQPLARALLVAEIGGSERWRLFLLTITVVWVPWGHPLARQFAPLIACWYWVVISLLILHHAPFFI